MKLTMSLVTASALLWVLVPPPARPATNTEVTVMDTVTIKAAPGAVWEAIRQQRSVDPSRRKLVSSSGHKYVVKEQFEGLPVIGSTSCLYEELEVPMERIDYKMIESDKLKCFDGAYTFPSRSDSQTVLQLSSRTDTGIDLPFGKTIAKQSTLKLLRKKLTAIKTLAESRSM